MEDKNNSGIAKLLDEITEENLADISYDDILNLRKKLNPYGRTIEGSDNYITFSYTDLTEKYLTKFITTSMIGFLHRMCDEWNVPEDIPVVPVYDYIKDPSKLDISEEEEKLESEKSKQNREYNKEQMKKRVIVMEFLEHLFQFDPELHAKPAYKPNFKDKERDLVNTPASQLAINQREKIDSDFKNESLKHKHKKILSKDNCSYITVNKSDSMQKIDETDVHIEQNVYNMLPPDDTYHRFRIYMERNYEKIREIVSNLYCEKPIFEKAINPFSFHKDKSDADDFIAKHKDEVITEILPAQTGKWNFFGSFKNVRESVRYFNDNTIVLEEITKQIESDQKLGYDLMKKRVYNKKKQNIEEDGPDDPAFLKWRENNTTLKEMGADIYDPKVYDTCPDDAIEVPIIRIKDGGRIVEKDKFYSKTEPILNVNG